MVNMKMTFQDAFASYENHVLTIGNSCFKRVFDLSGRLLRTIGLYDGDGKICAGENPSDRDFYFYGDRCPADEMFYEEPVVSAVAVPHPMFDAPHLHVIVTLKEDRQQMILRRDFYVYPGLSALAMRCRIYSPVYMAAVWNFRPTIRKHMQTISREGFVYEGCVDRITPLPEFKPEQLVLYRGRTDFTDDQVIKLQVSGSELNGNLLFLRRSDGKSLFFLQEAPPSEERRDLEEYDFRIGDDGSVFSCSWNLSPDELGNRFEFRSARSILFLAEKREDELDLLQRYQMLRFPAPQVPPTANPWGDCSGKFYSAICEKYLLDEVRSTAECGAGIYLIDDSWQAGGVLGDITGRNSLVDSEKFWKVRPELWNGDLLPLTEEAHRLGIGVGLWFAPASNVRYRDWKKMRKILLDFHFRCGIRFFKLDAMSLSSAESERNLELLMRSVCRASHGKIAFLIDLTGWGLRQGYFRFLEYGAVFLENRYTRLNTGLGYHPERTWRNVWRLAEFNPLQKFQIEVPSDLELNYEFYRMKNETPPDVYPWDYWIAITLFAKPLLWLAPSKLSAEKKALLNRFMTWQRNHTAELEQTQIRHFGPEPNGQSLSGLYTISGKRLLLAFRELRSEADSVMVPSLLAEKKWNLIFGHGKLENGCLLIPDAPGFALFEEADNP